MSKTDNVPLGWQVASLDELCEIQLGKMLSPSSKEGNNPCPYLRNANVQWGRFDLSDVLSMDFDMREQQKFALRCGDVLVCEGGEPGRAAVWEGQIEPCYYQKALHRLRVKPHLLDPYFLYFRLWFGGLNNEFGDSHGKTTIAHLPAIRLAKVSIAFPSLSQQQRLVDTLREQMQAIERAKAAADEQLRAASDLIHVIMSGSLNHPDVSTPLLTDCLTEVTHGVGSRWGEYPLLGVARSGLSIPKQGLGKNPERYKLVARGTIFYNPMRILLGSIGLVDDENEPGIASPDYVVFRCNEAKVHPRWFYHWMRSEFGEAFIKSMARGAVRERLLFRRLAAAQGQIPPYEVQEKVAQQLKHIETMVKGIEAQRAEIEKLPALLIDKAFRGEFSKTERTFVFPKRPTPKDAFTSQGFVSSYAVARLHAYPTFGDVQHAKVGYLVEAHLGIDLGGRYERMQAGPFDQRIYMLTGYARKNGWYEAHRRSSGIGRYYTLGPNIQAQVDAATEFLGDRRAALDELLDIFATQDTESIEILATLYAAWNDFLLDGTNPSDADVIREVRENWHESKRRFTPKRLQSALDWMREMALVPSGNGPHTRPVAPTAVV